MDFVGANVSDKERTIMQKSLGQFRIEKCNGVLVINYAFKNQKL